MVPRMIELGRQTFMPVQILDLKYTECKRTSLFYFQVCNLSAPVRKHDFMRKLLIEEIAVQCRKHRD